MKIYKVTLVVLHHRTAKRYNLHFSAMANSDQEALDIVMATHDLDGVSVLGSKTEEGGQPYLFVSAEPINS